MKKALLKTVLILTVCSVLMVFCSSFAGSTAKELAAAPELIAYIEELAVSTAASLGAAEKTEFTVVEVYNLNKFSSSEYYTLFLFEEGGHAVYDNATGVVEELCVDDSGLAERLDLTKEYYYGGPGNFIVKEGEAFFDVGANIQLTTAEINAASRKEESVNSARILGKSGDLQRGPVRPETTTENIINNVTYFHSLLSDAQFGDGTTGTNVHIATAILLGYHDYYTFDGLISPQYHYKENGVRKPGTTVSYISYLQNILGANENNLISAAASLDIHFDISLDFDLLPEGVTLNLYYASESAQRVFNVLEDEIELNNPVAIAMSTSMGATMNRSVVAYGYKEVVSGSGSTITYYVQTGTENPLRASYSSLWFGEYMYINETIE